MMWFGMFSEEVLARWFLGVMTEDLYKVDAQRKADQAMKQYLDIETYVRGHGTGKPDDYSTVVGKSGQVYKKKDE